MYLSFQEFGSRAHGDIQWEELVIIEANQLRMQRVEYITNNMTTARLFWYGHRIIARVVRDRK